MQSLDSTGVVLFAGSFSKVLFPSLRLGYIVIPPRTRGSLCCRALHHSRHAPLLDQSILCAFIEEGYFGRHLRRMRTKYAERLSILMEESQSRLAGLLELSSVQAGLQTVCWLRNNVNAETAAAAAAARGVEVTPVQRYSLGNRIPNALQLGFAAFDAREIRRGVRELAIALERCHEPLRLQ